jgi:hypothetical protein
MTDEEVHIQRVQNDKFNVCKKSKTASGSTSFYAHVIYTRAQLEQLIIEAKKLLDEAR